VAKEEIIRILKQIWPATWRFGTGTLLYSGSLQIGSLVYAQIGKPSQVATFLLSSQALNILRTTSQAPFYSKLPQLARLYAEQNLTGLTKYSQRGMRLSYWTFAAGFLFLGVFGTFLLDTIGSPTPFAKPSLWLVMGTGAILERFGGMHQNVIAISGDTRSHIAGIGFAIVFGVSISIGSRWLDVFVVPFSILVGHILFFSLYSAIGSYKSMKTTCFHYEAKSGIPGAASFVIACALYIMFMRTIGGHQGPF
jgi:hypothetical protein